jgi:glycosyltransferase involved in cell wall biosynthesis
VIDPLTHVAVIIPALNEEAALPTVLGAIPSWVRSVIVVDNGSTDRSASVARACGATVVTEPVRGYGAACLEGLAHLVAAPPDIVVFLDGDASDCPEEMADLVGPIVSGDADLVVGSRIIRATPGALTPQQRFGNWLATRLLHAWFGVRYTDLGPFRAIRYGDLVALDMRDRDFGWTVEMQAKAARTGLRHLEIPVSYHPRIGQSKISGTLRGTVLAGRKILLTLWRLRPPTTSIRPERSPIHAP